MGKPATTTVRKIFGEQFQVKLTPELQTQLLEARVATIRPFLHKMSLGSLLDFEFIETAGKKENLRRFSFDTKGDGQLYTTKGLFLGVAYYEKLDENQCTFKVVGLTRSGKWVWVEVGCGISFDLSPHVMSRRWALSVTTGFITTEELLAKDRVQFRRLWEWLGSEAYGWYEERYALLEEAESLTKKIGKEEELVETLLGF